jgi:hypothetical protein
MITGSLDAVPPRFSATGVYHRRGRHAEHSGDFPPAFALSAQPHGLVAPEYPARSSKAFAAPLCRTNAGRNALPDEFALEFRERGEYMQQQGCAQWSPERFAVRDSTQVLAVPPRGPSTSC